MLLIRRESDASINHKHCVMGNLHSNNWNTLTQEIGTVTQSDPWSLTSFTCCVQTNWVFDHAASELWMSDYVLPNNCSKTENNYWYVVLFKKIHVVLRRHPYALCEMIFFTQIDHLSAVSVFCLFSPLHTLFFYMHTHNCIHVQYKTSAFGRSDCTFSSQLLFFFFFWSLYFLFHVALCYLYFYGNKLHICTCCGDYVKLYKTEETDHRSLASLLTCAVLWVPKSLLKKGKLSTNSA